MVGTVVEMNGGVNHHFMWQTITLRWADTSNNESGFVMEQRVGPGGAFAILQDNLAADWPTTNVTPAGGQEYGYRVYAWNAYGNSSPTNEVVIAPPPSVGRRIAGGLNHTCALLSNGSLKCWGYNAAGELGNGGSSNALLPSSTVGPTGTARLDAGQDQTCVVLFDGGMKCWGAGAAGQIGNGANANAFVPQAVLNFP